MPCHRYAISVVVSSHRWLGLASPLPVTSTVKHRPHRRTRRLLLAKPHVVATDAVSLIRRRRLRRRLFALLAWAHVATARRQHRPHRRTPYGGPSPRSLRSRDVSADDPHTLRCGHAFPAPSQRRLRVAHPATLQASPSPPWTSTHARSSTSTSRCTRALTTSRQGRHPAGSLPAGFRIRIRIRLPPHPAAINSPPTRPHQHTVHITFILAHAAAAPPKPWCTCQSARTTSTGPHSASPHAQCQEKG